MIPRIPGPFKNYSSEEAGAILSAQRAACRRFRSLRVWTQHISSGCFVRSLDLSCGSWLVQPWRAGRLGTDLATLLGLGRLCLSADVFLGVASSQRLFAAGQIGSATTALDQFVILFAHVGRKNLR